MSPHLNHISSFVTHSMTEMRQVRNVFYHSTLSSIFLCHFYGISLDVDGGMIWMILEWGKFLMEKILIAPIPWPSLSFWVIVKCLFCHSMAIQILNDLRMKEMMLEWEFSHPGMMVSDLNEGGMRIFLKQGKCTRFFSFSLCPHLNNISSFDTHSMTEMCVEIPSFFVIHLP